MEVDRHSFNGLLVTILGAVSKAHFVSIDLELSGIHFRSHDWHRPTMSRPSLESLQERYTRTKKAAEKYQILQVGLTVVEEDVKRGKDSIGLGASP